MSRSQWLENGTRHSAIQRCIHTLNLEFLPHRIYAPDTKQNGQTVRDGQCDYYKNKVRGQGDPKMVRNTPPSQDASTHQTFIFYLKEYRRYAQDTKQDGRSAITICLPKFLAGHKNIMHGLVKMYVMRWPFCWTTFLFDLVPSCIGK